MFTVDVMTTMIFLTFLMSWGSLWFSYQAYLHSKRNERMLTGMNRARRGTDLYHPAEVRSLEELMTDR